jgi:hypothetical protein
LVNQFEDLPLGVQAFKDENGKNLPRSAASTKSWPALRSAKSTAGDVVLVPHAWEDGSGAEAPLDSLRNHPSQYRTHLHARAGRQRLK